MYVELERLCLLCLKKPTFSVTLAISHPTYFCKYLRRPTKKRGTLKVKCEKAFTLDTLLINKSLIKMKVVFCRQQVKSQSLN